MMPSIHKSNDTKFNTSGIGMLTAIKCNVVSSVSGKYELTATILQNDEYIDYVKVGNMICAKPSLNEDKQAFIIEQINKDINGEIEIYATHISQYRSKLIPIQPFEATDIQDAFSKVISNSLEDNPFTLTTPRTTQVSYSLKEPRTMRDILGGVEGSLLDVYGGEYIFDNLDIQMVNRRGSDKGFRVMYGQNMTKYEEETGFSWTSSITGVLPFYKNEETTIVGDIQYSQYANLYPYKKTITYDFSEKFEEPPTIQELNTVGANYINNKGLTSISINASFDDISSFPEYAEFYSNIEGIELGDVVTIVNSWFGTDVKTRIQEFDYNVLLDRYDNIVLGDVKGSINDAIRNTAQQITYENNINIGGDELSIKDVINPSVSGGSITYHNLKYAKNIDGDKFMVWGDFSVRGAGSSTSITMDLGLQVKTPPNDIDIYGILWLYQASANQSALPFMRIDTNGNVKLIYICSTNNTTFYVPPTVINLTNFIGV